MTDDGQGLALKGADEVGDAPEDNTISLVNDDHALIYQHQMTPHHALRLTPQPPLCVRLPAFSSPAARRAASTSALTSLAPASRRSCGQP